MNIEKNGVLFCLFVFYFFCVSLYANDENTEFNCNDQCAINSIVDWNVIWIVAEGECLASAANDLGNKIREIHSSPVYVKVCDAKELLIDGIPPHVTVIYLFFAVHNMEKGKVVVGEYSDATHCKSANHLPRRADLFVDYDILEEFFAKLSSISVNDRLTPVSRNQLKILFK